MVASNTHKTSNKVSIRSFAGSGDQRRRGVAGSCEGLEVERELLLNLCALRTTLVQIYISVLCTAQAIQLVGAGS